MAHLAGHERGAHSSRSLAKSVDSGRGMNIEQEQEFQKLAQKHKFLQRALAVREKQDPKITGYIVVDIETTGLDCRANDIIEIAAVRVTESVDHFETFVKPSSQLPSHIQNITGIHDNMLQGAPQPADALAKFLDFAGDLPMVAHNAEFDLGFLRFHTFKELTLKLQNRVICTVKLARYLYPDLPNHKLDTVATALEVSAKSRHRAGGDAETTLQVFQEMIGALSPRGFRTIEKIVALSEELDERELAPF